jgi:hypothetical protein
MSSTKKTTNLQVLPAATLVPAVLVAKYDPGARELLCRARAVVRALETSDAANHGALVAVALGLLWEAEDALAQEGQITSASRAVQS